MTIITLNNWKIVVVKRHANTPLEQKRPLIAGYDEKGRKHLFFYDRYDSEKELVIGKHGVSYLLGTINPEYGAKFPNAKEQFFEALKEKNATKTPPVQKEKWWSNAIHALGSLWPFARSQDSSKRQK
jgi:hypothetical protein